MGGFRVFCCFFNVPPQSQPAGLQDQHCAVHVPGHQSAEPRARHHPERSVPRRVAPPVPALLPTKYCNAL